MPGKIEIKNFSKNYGEMAAVKNLTLTVESGELFGLIGPDGAGKTSTMRSICTLLNCEQGEIIVDGFDVRDHVVPVRSILGYMPQRFSLYPDLTVEQNLRFFAELFGVRKAEMPERLQKMYQFSKLEPFKKRLASALSGGMKQKLALSCTLIHTPRILVLDEPTTGVDPVSRREFWEILRQLSDEEVTILVSTPYMDEADLCNRVAFMFEGNVMALDRPEAMPEYYPYTLYEISAEDTRSLVSFFKLKTKAVSVQLFGDRLHVSFQNELLESDIASIKRSQQEISSFRNIAPSTEDTFLALMRQNGA